MAYPSNLIAQNTWAFQENIGQLKENDGKTNSSCAYFGNQGNVAIYAGKGKISFVFSHTKKEATDSVFDDYQAHKRWVKNGAAHKAIIGTSRMDMVFESCNQQAIIIPEDMEPGFINAYTSNMPIGIQNIRSFKTLRYKNIYDGIDMVLRCGNKGLKYEFILQPGARFSDIKILWKGIDKIDLIANGGLTYVNPSGKLEEIRPFCYTSEGKEVASSFEVQDHAISFNIGAYNKTEALTIDPVLSWASYYGGGGEGSNGAFNVSTDTANNVFTGFVTQTASGISSSGAYQTSRIGNTDAFVVKFNDKGIRQWATYFGFGNMVRSAVATDKAGNVYLAGHTRDTGLATKGAHQTSFAGDIDGYLVKFSPAGKLLWSTYFGGDSTDNIYGIQTDGNGNVLLGGVTFSAKGIATKGAFQTKYQGSGDAFLAKFNANGLLQWSTYFGGTAQNEGLCIATDAKGDAILGGQTNSSGMATSGAYKTSYSGGFGDAFIALFDSMGVRRWSTYYGDTAYEFATATASDPDNNIYFAGETESAKHITTPGSHQPTYGGGFNDAYLAKFSNTGNLLWSTYYGGQYFDAITSLAVDTCGFALAAGTTTSDTGIGTRGDFDSANAGNASHAFLARFNPLGKLVYGTYYSGNKGEAGNGVAIDHKNSVYLSGYTGSDKNIATPTGYQTSLKGNSNAFLAKFTQISPPVTAGKSQSIKCFGDTVVIGSAAQKYVQYSWISKPAGFTSTKANPTVTPKTTTTYYLAAIPKEGCPVYDSVKITVLNVFVSIKMPKSDSICLGDSLKIGAKGVAGYSYAWHSNPAGFSANLANPEVAPKTSTMYYLTETHDTTGCTFKDTTTIFVKPLPKPDAGPDKSICVGETAIIGYNGTSGNKYLWASNPGSFSSVSPEPTVSPTVSTTYYLKETNPQGCSAIDTVFVTVNLLPTPKAGDNIAICLGDSLQLKYVPIKNHIFQWTGKPGGFVSTDSVKWVKPGISTTYLLKETIVATGCTKTDSFRLSVNPLPLAATGGNKTICEYQKIRLGGGSNAGNTYLWTSHPGNFSSSISNPDVSPLLKTTYILRETTPAGCSKTDSAVISVNPGPPDPHLNHEDSICAGGTTAILFHPAKGNTFSWSSVPAGFSSTDSVITVSPAFSTQYILLQKSTANNCPRSDTVNLEVVPLPRPQINGSKIICGTISSSFNCNFRSGYKYHWDVNGGSILSGQNTTAITINWPKLITGSVKLTETAPFGCKNSDSIIVNVVQPPRAGFGFENGCQNDTVHFKDSSLFADKLLWDPGNGTLRTERNPDIIYTIPGKYTVTQFASTKDGCADTLTKSLTIFPLPLVKWFIKKDTGQSITFNVSDTINKAFAWQFGDLKTSTLAHGKHYYQKSATYPLQLITTSQDGCTSKLDSSIIINFTFPHDSIFVFPNPFTDKLQINYILTENAHVKIYLYDDIGRLIYTLRDEEQAPGVFSFNIDDRGQALAPAIYLLKFIINDKTTIIRVLKAG